MRMVSRLEYRYRQCRDTGIEKALYGPLHMAEIEIGINSNIPQGGGICFVRSTTFAV
jgi:hypothetical protein